MDRVITATVEHTEQKVRHIMKFGGDFFKVLNLVILIMRMFGKVFGDDDDKKAIADSEGRSKDNDVNHTV